MNGPMATIARVSEMATYKAEIITQVLYIEAESEDEAESKYDAYFNDEECPCGGGSECGCIDDGEECFHNMELWQGEGQ